MITHFTMDFFLLRGRDETPTGTPLPLRTVGLRRILRRITFRRVPTGVAPGLDDTLGVGLGVGAGGVARTGGGGGGDTRTGGGGGGEAAKPPAVAGTARRARSPMDRYLRTTFLHSCVFEHIGA